MPAKSDIPKKENSTEKQLSALRNALVQLHQMLLEYQRKHYEKQNGRIKSTSRMFELVRSNKQFMWLRGLSELIVGLDSYLDNGIFTIKNSQSLLQYTKRFLGRNKHSNEFEKLYYAAIENDPEVLIAHRRVMSHLKPAKPD